MIDAKNKIMVMGKWEASKNTGASVWLKAACDCGCEDHDLCMWIEWDEDFELIELHFHNKLINIDPYSDMLGPGFFKSIGGYFNKVRNILVRIKRAYKLLIYGHVEVESDFIFHEEEQIEDFVTALRQSYWHVKNGKKKEE